MPFTPSHPAITIPLMRAGLVPSALAIGSMVPDAPLFFPLPATYGETHAIPGIVGVDLVLGLVGFAVWQGLLAPAIVAAAPAGLRSRLAPDLPRPLRSQLGRPWGLVAVVSSLWVGAASHVLWDAFTHPGRWGVRQIAWLEELHWGMVGHGWAQHASSVLGLALLALAAALWWRRTLPADEATPQRIPALDRAASRRAAAAVVGCAVVAAALGAAAGMLGGEAPASVLFLIATWGGAAGVVAALACAVVVRVGSRSA